ncbi:hypothetical protein [Saccharothrix stipae]
MSARRGDTAQVGGGEELTQEAIRGFGTAASAEVLDAFGTRPADVAGVATDDPEHPHPPVTSPAGDGSPAEVGQVGPAGLPQTPAASLSWTAAFVAKGSPSDAQISVSETHVVTTIVNRIAFRHRDGTLLKEMSPAQEFFAPLKLVESGLACEGREVTDLRTIYDSYRKRFWIVGGTGNTGAKCPNVPPEKVRGIIVVAVSKTSNPLDGWHLYWWDAVAGPPAYQPGDGADYPCIGIDAKCFYQTNSVAGRYWRVTVWPADQMAAGVPASQVAGWQFWDLENPDGSPVKVVIQPCVHHGPTNNAAYFVNRFSTDQLVVWRLQNPLTPQQQMVRTSVVVKPFGAPQNAPQKNSLSRIQMTNLGTDVVKVVYRHPNLVLVCNDGKDWFGDGQVLSSIRLVRVSVLGFPNLSTAPNSGFIDRTFGKNSLDDAPADHVHYGWPAVEVNKYQNMVVVYARSGQTLYPEVRFSAYLNTETDIRPSRLLQAGGNAYGGQGGSASTLYRWGDLAGASVDPKDDTAIWVAQQFANADGSYDVAVGKVFQEVEEF